MLDGCRISAVVCSTDLERSQEFYKQKLGLTLSPETAPNHLLFEGADGTSLLVYGRPGANQADHTQVRFWSADVEADVRKLVSRGVVFRRLRLPGAQDRRPRGDDGRPRQVGVAQGPRRQHPRAVSGRVAAR